MGKSSNIIGMSEDSKIMAVRVEVAIIYQPTRENFFQQVGVIFLGSVIDPFQMDAVC